MAKPTPAPPTEHRMIHGIAPQTPGGRPVPPRVHYYVVRSTVAIGATSLVAGSSLLATEPEIAAARLPPGSLFDRGALDDTSVLSQMAGPGTPGGVRLKSVAELRTDALAVEAAHKAGIAAMLAEGKGSVPTPEACLLAVNQLREDVARWRDLNYEGVTPVTRELLRSVCDAVLSRPDNTDPTATTRRLANAEYAEVNG